MTGQVFQVSLYALRARSANAQLVELDGGYRLVLTSTDVDHDVEVGLHPGTMQANDAADAGSSSLEWALKVFPPPDGWVCHKVAISPMNGEAVLAAVKCLTETPESAVADVIDEASLEWPEMFNDR
jgi:hypothetical protein